MFEQYFNLIRIPFCRDIPETELYSTPSIEELCERLQYAARNRLFAAVTGDVGTGKTTALRKLVDSLDINRYKVMYIYVDKYSPRSFRERTNQ